LGGYCRRPQTLQGKGALSLNQNLTDNSRKRSFSGIQPTGPAHVGNFLGAIRNWVEGQGEQEGFYCIVDLHAMTAPWDPADLRAKTLDKAAELLACGIDPGRSVLFVQSDVPEHAELAWILTCTARMGELRRMVQFKERSKGEAESVGVGVFSYPVLQAADVLLYRAHGVPVGEDQRQHVELMRDLAVRFNSTFGDTFVVPMPWIREEGARIMALDAPTQKMSKSDMDVRPLSGIFLTDDPDAIRKKLKVAVTDSGREVRAAPDKPALANLLEIYSLLTRETVGELEERFDGSGYGDFKAEMAEAVIEALAPIRTRYEELVRDSAELSALLARGAEKATDIAATTMADVRARTGLGPRPGRRAPVEA
jgi:tryptophanyl-tRNA synthetase